MKTMIKTLPVLALALFMAACGGSKKNYELLTAHEWVLDKVEFADSASQIVIPGEKDLKIMFVDSNKMVYGVAPCNGFFGRFDVDGDDITFGNLASTMMYCPEMPFESSYHAWLGTVKTYDATDNTLTLRDGDNKLTLHYITK